MAKPDPRFFRLLLERHGLTARDCVFIDDAPHNVAGARAVGLHALEFRDPDRLKDELGSLGFFAPALSPNFPDGDAI